MVDDFTDGALELLMVMSFGMATSLLGKSYPIHGWRVSLICCRIRSSFTSAWHCSKLKMLLLQRKRRVDIFVYEKSQSFVLADYSTEPVPLCFSLLLWLWHTVFFLPRNPSTTLHCPWKPTTSNGLEIIDFRKPLCESVDNGEFVYNDCKFTLQGDNGSIRSGHFISIINVRAWN